MGLKQALAEGRYEEVLEELRRQISETPGDAKLFHRLALTNAHMGALEEAIEAQRQALALDPDNPRYTRALANYLEHNGDLDESQRVAAGAEGLKDAQAGSFADAQRDEKARLAGQLHRLVRSCEEIARFRQVDNLDRAELLFDRHPLDIGEWREFTKRRYDTGDVAEVAGIGRFELIDHGPIRKRLARGIAWELPIAALLSELAFRCDPTAVMVDVGANIGTHTVVMGRHHRGTVLAFEPVPAIYGQLEANLELNRISNAVPSSSACSAEPGKGSMTRILDRNPGMAQLSLTESGETTVTTIDAERERLGRPIALIKIDVEEHESEVLQGARGTLREDSPFILCEINVGDEAAALLGEMGYTVERYFRNNFACRPPGASDQLTAARG